MELTIFGNKWLNAAIVLLILFILSFTLYRTTSDRYRSKFHDFSEQLFSHNADLALLSNRLLLMVDNRATQSLLKMYKTHQRLRYNSKNVYKNIIAKYMSPWLKETININGKNMTVDQSFPIFSSAHMLELELLSAGVNAHYRITRYIKQVTKTGSIKWVLRPGKPSLQFVLMPCSGLASHGLTPDFLKTNTSKPFMHLGFWKLLRHVIDISENADLPDHVDLYINIDDKPWLDVDRKYHVSPLRELAIDMRQTSLPTPIFNYCGKSTKLDIPFVYVDQLLAKPVENLLDRLLTFRNRSNNELAQMLLEFKRRNDTAIWRGSTTGQLYHSTNWLRGQRSQLVQLSMMAPHLLDARFTYCSNCLSGVAEIMNSSFGQWWGAKMMYSEAYFESKFLVDLDGNGWSSRFYELMLTGATVFKVDHTEKCDEFWYDLLRPGIDFVSVAKDMHDLLPKLMYYRAHPEEALRIANSGMERVSFVLRADIWPQYVTGILRAFGALQTKPDSTEEQRMASLGLKSEVCNSVSSDWCSCKPI